MYDPALVGPFSSATKTRNAQLSTTGADVIALFGVAKGFGTAIASNNGLGDLQNFLASIGQPAPMDQAVAHFLALPADQQAKFGFVFSVEFGLANAAGTLIVPSNDTGELQQFLADIGLPSGPDQAVKRFQALPKELQGVFAEQVFFAELKSVADPTSSSFHKNQIGYQMVDSLFPATLGYTANALGGGANGASVRVPTGDLNLLHSTIQTEQGGSISLLGPGGNIVVGSLATEPNTNLKLRNLGILTLAGGAINTFTDANVLVNSSRVLTTQGGDILMWSSNGNLDAGRGSKTTLSLPPLQVEFDQNDYETVDLGGLVTGAGIGVLQSSRLAAISNIDLLAPHGTVDAGTASIRSSGNLNIVAPVVLNANNITVGGTATGVPTVAAPNLGALTAASSAAGAAAKTAELPTGSVGNRDPDSIFMVEVVGYGGSGGQDQSQTCPDGSAKPCAEQSNKPKSVPASQ
jgi:hypothetical protein